MHTAVRLLTQGHTVFGIDNLNPYYDVQLKLARLRQLERLPGFRFFRLDIGDGEAIHKIFSECNPDRIVHLAAQVGVRNSIDHPEEYIDSNVVGFANLLEACRRNAIKHFVYASSSSVYGSNSKLPFSVEDRTDHPISLYAATKKSNELMAHVYSHLFGIPCTGLRFFTVYGPWGRPDMAMFSFTKAITEGLPIRLFNNGDMKRDFTYIDDIVEGLIRVLERPPVGKNGEAPYRLYNIGNRNPVQLLEFIAVLERCLNKKAITKLEPMQPGDVQHTFADVKALEWDTGFRPDTTIETGIARFVEWYFTYYELPIGVMTGKAS